MQIKVELAKEARKSGGDKYESTGALAFNVYIPQVISRTRGYAAKSFMITIEETS
jgi:hypothetical protein